MTTKQRLACGAAILRSIDARRQRTGNRNELLALEQAIVDRELMELVTGGLCDEKRELAGVASEATRAGSHEGHGSAL